MALLGKPIDLTGRGGSTDPSHADTWPNARTVPAAAIRAAEVPFFSDQFRFNRRRHDTQDRDRMEGDVRLAVTDHARRPGAEPADARWMVHAFVLWTMKISSLADICAYFDTSLSWTRAEHR